jgi:hypothetical protein
MFRRVFIAVAAICLMGQGCLPTAPNLGLLPTKDPGGQPSPDGLIPYHNGFGALPGSPLATTSTGVVPMNFLVNVPALPEEVTVLREWAAGPDDTLVRNVTGALRLPAGMLGADPKGEALIVRWQGTDGINWSADASRRSVNFIRQGASPLPVQRVGEAERAQITARTFLTDHGIDVSEWGDPVARAYDVAFAQSRDGLPVVQADGTSALSAAISTDASGMSVTQGSFELPDSDVERSNYPTLSMDEVIQRLQAGGTNPLRIRDTAVAIEEMSLAYMPVMGEVGGMPRTYFIPVLWAHGTAMRNGTNVPYGTTVPLVRDDAFVK